MSVSSDRTVVDEVCARALAGLVPSHDELQALLALPDAQAAEPLFAAARELRRHHFGDVVFLYGFVYFSTYCRNSCAFCYYRSDNTTSPRYRKDVNEVVDICVALAESGVNLLDLTMGEDPRTHDDGMFGEVIELVGRVREATGKAIMVSPGVVPPADLARLAAAGADWYACYQETHTPELYAGLRLGQGYEERVAARHRARAAGMLVEDGILTGVGDSAADRATSILTMRAEGHEQVRIMTFVPQEDTPLAHLPAPHTFDELLTIAAMRLAMPDRLIPASLDVEGIDGLRPRLDAGANIVTSIVPPTTGLCGVALAERDIDEGLRTVAEVRARLKELGLRQGSDEEYGARLRTLKEGVAR